MNSLTTDILRKRCQTEQRIIKRGGYARVLLKGRLIRWGRAYLISAVVGLVLSQMTLVALLSANETGINDALSQAFRVFTFAIMEASGEFSRAFLDSLAWTIIYTLVPVLILYAVVTSSGWIAWWRFAPVFAFVPILIAIVLALVLNPPGLFALVLPALWFSPAFAIAGFVFGWLLGAEHDW